ncbi:MAG: LysM peptidoglycan-binding domain-containing protein [Paludibacteraceae bacterium]|nr:LysM peptidoglycan-binding domain-containing protein [Paludibacteraceae bacterium]
MKKYFIGISLSLTMLFQAFAIGQTNNYKIKVVGGKEYYEYPVETSEGFYSVSKKFHISEEEIKAANPSAANGLTKGSTLLIPVPKYDIHKVQKDETLYSVKQKYNTSYDELYKLNPTLKDGGLVAGSEIRVPKNGSANKPLLAQAPAPTAETKPGFTSHEVKAGETLFSISQRYNVSVDEITRLNPSVKSGLQNGQTLIIPPSHANTASTNTEAPKQEAPKSNGMMKTHKVQKDETLFGICQKYGVSREDLLRINPGLEGNIKEGQVLTIPADSKPEVVEKVKIRQMHVVKRKETVASISKMYDLTEAELLKANPIIDKEVKKGMTIVIPEKESVQEKKINYGTHTVQKGETLYRISKTYGIEIDDIILLNPTAYTELKEGQTLLIAQPDPTTATKVELNGFELHTVSQDETIYGIGQKYGLEPELLYHFNPDTKEKLSVGKILLIPDSLHRSLALKKEKDTTPKKELNIALALPFQFSKVTETSVLEKNAKKFVEFYQGMLIAIDSMKKKGISTNLFVYDSGKSDADAKKLFANDDLKKMDFIIGPAYTTQIKAFSEFSEKNNIKLIIPFSSKSEGTMTNPNIFQPNTPQDQHNYLTAKAIINTFKLDNIVLVSFKDPAYNNLNQLSDTLKAMLKAAGKIYTEVTYSNIESVKSGLISKSDNAVVTLTTNQVALNKILPVLNMLGEKHSIKIVGFPEWQSYQSITKDMFQQETFIPSTFHINFNDEHVRTYLKRYRSLYRSEPDNSQSNQTQYGMLGYDLTMYFSEAMSNFGRDFEENIGNIPYKPLQCDFKFKKINEMGGYYNHHIYFIDHNAQTGLTAVTFE